MRCSDGRAAIIACIEAITPDTKAGPGDKFVVYRGSKEPNEAPERVTMVRLLAPPVKDEANTCDAYRATFQVVHLYSHSDNIDDRVGDDVERSSRACVDSALIARQADIIEVAPGDPVIDDSGALVASRRDITLVYRISSALL